MGNPNDTLEPAGVDDAPSDGGKDESLVYDPRTSARPAVKAKAEKAEVIETKAKPRKRRGQVDIDLSQAPWAIFASQVAEVAASLNALDYSVLRAKLATMIEPGGLDVSDLDQLRDEVSDGKIKANRYAAFRQPPTKWLRTPQRGHKHLVLITQVAPNARDFAKHFPDAAIGLLNSASDLLTVELDLKYDKITIVTGYGSSNKALRSFMNYHELANVFEMAQLDVDNIQKLVPLPTDKEVSAAKATLAKATAASAGTVIDTGTKVH